MQRYLLKDHWAQLVNQFKDSERESFDQDGYATEQLSLDILDYIRRGHFRQWTLFTQKRGEEFDLMMTKLQARGHDLEALRRFVNDDELWAITLELGQQ
jgi:hypothetical protein